MQTTPNFISVEEAIKLVKDNDNIVTGLGGELR